MIEVLAMGASMLGGFLGLIIMLGMIGYTLDRHLGRIAKALERLAERQ